MVGVRVRVRVGKIVYLSAIQDPIDNARYKGSTVHLVFKFELGLGLGLGFELRLEPGLALRSGLGSG